MTLTVDRIRQTAPDYRFAIDAARGRLRTSDHEPDQHAAAILNKYAIAMFA